MPTRRRPLTDSPFDTLERTFTLLSSGPNPLALDGHGITGLPDRPVPIGELKARLLHPSTAFEARDAIVGELVARSQTHGGRWTVALAGVLLPGLRRAIWPLVQACPGRADELESEALTAFLAAVASCQPGRARLASRLCWLARSGAQRLLQAELIEFRPGSDPVSAAPPRPWGHPDLVLACRRARQRDLRRGRRADRRHPPWPHRPGRGRRAARPRLLGLPQAAPAGRISPRRVGHRR